MTIIERLQKNGIHRIGSPARGFRYLGPGGKPATAVERARIQALRIPPAWTAVVINAQARGNVQAVGLDAAGRWQYRYHPAQLARRERTKRERMIHFIEALPRMRRAVARDLARPGIPREKVLAGILRILSSCFLRPGSSEYAYKYGSYGLATLQRRHVAVKGTQVHFDFRGKSGRRQQQALRDHRLARLIRELLKYPGEVFKFRDERGSIVDVRRRHINGYIKEIMNGDFSAKDFRTWAGTLLCACALAREIADGPLPKQARRKRVAGAIREVARHLGNTPAVCRASYVFPSILRSFERGRVIRFSLDGVAALADASPHHLERTERALLELLDSPERTASARGRAA